MVVSAQGCDHSQLELGARDKSKAEWGDQSIRNEANMNGKELHASM